MCNNIVHLCYLLRQSAYYVLCDLCLGLQLLLTVWAGRVTTIILPLQSSFLTLLSDTATHSVLIERHLSGLNDCDRPHRPWGTPRTTLPTQATCLRRGGASSLQRVLGHMSGHYRPDTRRIARHHTQSRPAVSL